MAEEAQLTSHYVELTHSLIRLDHVNANSAQIRIHGSKPTSTWRYKILVLLKTQCIVKMSKPAEIKDARTETAGERL